MSIAGDICGGIRDYVKHQNRRAARGLATDPVGFRPVQTSRFYEQAKRLKDGYVVDGVACTVAEYWDASIAVYAPDGPVKVLQSTAKSDALAFLNDADLGEAPDGGVYLNW